MARDAEAAGWDAVFLWDHLQWSTDLRPPVHNPWVLLGAMAAETERVRIGTLVTPLTRRRLQIVAKHLLTLDHLSGGRVTFRIGLGEPAIGDFSVFRDHGGPIARPPPTADPAVVQAFFKQLNRFEAALLKSHKVAPNASRIAHAGLDIAKSN